MIAFSIINNAGGTGKSTTAVSLASALAARNHRTLLVDMDGQGTTSEWMSHRDRSNQQMLFDFFCSTYELRPIIYQTKYENLDFVFSSMHMYRLDKALAGEFESTSILHEGLKEVANEYEFAVIDCPPSLSMAAWNCLKAAPNVIIPSETSIKSVLAMQGLLQAINLINARNKNVQILGVLPCKVKRNTIHDRECLEVLRSDCPVHIFDSMIHETVKLREALGVCEPIDRYAATSKAAEEYAAFTDELLNRMQGERYESEAA